jgi:DNA polymerase
VSENRSPEAPPELRGVLDYLRDIGYGELYAPTAKAGGSPAPTPTPQQGQVGKGLAPSREAAPTASVARPEVAPASNLEERASKLAILDQRVSGCTDCRLHEGRKKVVFGVGNPNADLMFIGEGPGAQEDRQGIPFVGPAGELLTKIIAAIELERSDVYIANIVKCRPPRNRDPQPDEVAACRGYLERQIELIRPKVIVALGRVAAQTLLGESTPLGRMRGHWYLVKGVETRVTYHPAALLRNASFKRPTWEDMQVVRDRVRELVAEEASESSIE